MNLVEIASAHHERAVVRAGNVYVKVETDLNRARRERFATSAAPIPAPAVLWWHEGPPTLLALAAVEGTSLAKLGEPSPHPPEAWRRAGAVARKLHQARVPVELDRAPISLPGRIDELRSWLLENSPAPPSLVGSLASYARDVLGGRDAEPVFTHGDLQAEHILIDGNEVSAVIDWSEGGRATRSETWPL